MKIMLIYVNCLYIVIKGYSARKSAVNMLNSCINTSLYKIFPVDHKHLSLLRQYLNVPFLKCSAKKRKGKFMNSLLAMPDFRPVLEVYGRGFRRVFIFIMVSLVF